MSLLGPADCPDWTEHLSGRLLGRKGASPNGGMGLVGPYKRGNNMRLGDAVATFAQPIARGIDSILGTDLEGCVGCKARRERLNQVSDELFTLLSWRLRSNDCSPMDYTVTKQVTAQFVIIGANTPEEAIEKAQKGEGQQSQSGQTWNATIRQQPQPQMMPHGR